MNAPDTLDFVQDAQSHPEGPDERHTEPIAIPVPSAQPAERTEPVFARASARVNPQPLRRPTDEYPLVYDEPRRDPASLRVPGVRQPTRPEVRRLWFGWGWSFTGFLIGFIGWGVWAASVRGQMVVPLVDLGIVVFVAVGVFVVCRLFGRVVWEGTFRRPRRSARLAHALTGLFLAAAGVGFLAHTAWIADAVTWLKTNL
jgi:hypothetical protein